MKDAQADELLELESLDEVRTLLGPLDGNTRLIRDLHAVNVLVREGSLRLLGRVEDVARVRGVLESQLAEMRSGRAVAAAEVARRLRVAAGVGDAPGAGASDAGFTMPRRSPGATRPRTPGQERYWKAIAEHDVVFGVGPAGTGKTYLAVAAAVAAIKSGAVRRIVLVRPAVEAGEKLGFLPGDLQQKINPYLRPLYDALHDLLDPAARQRYLENEIVEVCPLAYMRGRTLNDSFVILDEAQNCTVPQMLMFLTRMGERSQVVVTGDPSQVDLPPNTRSGLADAVRRLDGVQGVAIVRLRTRDIVRHPVVQRIIDAYDADAPRSARGRDIDRDLDHDAGHDGDHGGERPPASP
ncbi:MAG: PhoH family protein [Planctomycetes bacterium]|nr:PhoH family protein [Planctomycetota bacterium]